MTPSSSLVKQTARAAWSILSQVLLFTLFGIVVNWGCFAALGIPIWSRYCNVGTAGAHASGPGAILALALIAIVCFRAVILTVVLLFVFPILYFLVGKTRGIKLALVGLATQNRASIHDILKPILLSGLRTVRAASSEGKTSSSIKATSALLSKGVEQSKGLPRPIRWLIKGLLKKLKIAEVISEVNGLQSKGEGEALSQLQTRIDQSLTEKMKIGWAAPASLLVFNVMFVFALYWLTRN